ncbi:MAG TPA: lyase, partial [bacterium]|nr:lyase [bacterium]
ANLNTAVFDPGGVLWFTGQSGILGRLEAASGHMLVWDAPRGSGPYGIAISAQGAVFYASLAGSYVGRIQPAAQPDGTPSVRVLEPPTRDQGARRIWGDSQGNLWVSEWNAGAVARYSPAQSAWREWPLPGKSPLPYALYVDGQDQVWLSDFAANALVRFDPRAEQFTSFVLPTRGAAVRQLAGRHLAGRPQEVWGAESAQDKLVVLRLE